MKTFAHFLAAVLVASIVFLSAQAAPTNSSTPIRLNIKLFGGWRQAANTGYTASDTNNGNAATFYRGQRDNSLTIYWSESQSPVKISPDDLKDTAVRFGGPTNDSNVLLNSSGGLCAFGSVGTAIFHSAAWPRIRIWIVTNERYYSIEGVYTCSKAPDPTEVREVQNMMSTVTVGPESPK